MKRKIVEQTKNNGQKVYVAKVKYFIFGWVTIRRRCEYYHCNTAIARNPTWEKQHTYMAVETTDLDLCKELSTTSIKYKNITINKRVIANDINDLTDCDIHYGCYPTVFNESKSLEDMKRSIDSVLRGRKERREEYRQEKEDNKTVRSRDL